MITTYLVLAAHIATIAQAQSTLSQNGTLLAHNSTLHSTSSNTTSFKSTNLKLSAEATSTGVGNYVAAGVGLSSTPSDGPSASSSLQNTRDSTTSGLVSTSANALLSSELPSTTSISGSNSGLSAVPSSNHTLSITPSAPAYTLRNATAPITSSYPTMANQSTPANITGADSCWAAWQTYWSLSSTAATAQYIGFSTIQSGIFETHYITTTYTMPGFGGVDTTTTWTVDGITTTLYGTSSFEGAPVTTVAYTESQDPQTFTIVDSEAAVPAQTTTATIYSVQTIRPEIDTTLLAANVTTPPCALPSSYSACQSQWDTWASAELLPIPPPPSEPGCYPQGNYANLSSAPPLSTPACYAQWSVSLDMWSSMVTADRPACTQASFPDTACASLKDVYVSGQNLEVWPTALRERYYDGEMGFSVGSISFEGLDQQWAATAIPGYGANTESWYWPSSLEFAPGCSLDCGRCAVTGGLVQLLYFPPGLTHPATGEVVASTLGTVFTSPTMYISFADIHAGDACGTVGPTIQSTIIAFPTESTLMSQWAIPTRCGGDAVPRLSSYILTATASFNLTDILATPVPYSIRTSQISCAISIAGGGEYRSCDPNACISNTEYKPILVVPDAFLQSLHPDWASCSANIQGLYDPPKSLTPVSAEAGPTTPTAVSATIAPTPASGVTGTAAASTAGGQTAGSTPLQTIASVADSPSSTVAAPGSGSPASSNAQSPAAGTSNQNSVASSAGIVVDQDTTTNALDVLSAALSTFAAPLPSNTQQAVPQDPSTGIVLTGPSGNLVTAVQQGSAFVVSGLTAAATLVPGAATTIDDIALSVSSADPGQSLAGIVIVGQTQVLSATNLPVSGGSPAAMGSAQVLTGSNGQTVTIINSNSAAVIIGGSTTQIVKPGTAATTLNGVVVSADSSGIVHADNGASSLVLSSAHAAATSVTAPAAVVSGIVATGANGDVITVIQQGSSIVAVQSGQMIATVPAGSSMVLDGITISAAASTTDAGPSAGNTAVMGVVVDGQTLIPSSLPSPSRAAVATLSQTAVPILTTTGSDGQVVTILQQGSSLVIADAFSMTTIPAVLTGTSAVFDGISISGSARGSGAASAIVVVNGSPVTLASATPTNAHDVQTASTNDDGSEPGAETSRVGATSASTSTVRGSGTKAMTLMPPGVLVTLAIFAVLQLLETL